MNAVAKIQPAAEVAQETPKVPDNLALWSVLEKTSPSATKAFSRGGGFKGTAINGTYILKRLTETFGPCGKGWRFVLEDERIEIGHTLKNADHAKVHIIRGHLEYRDEGEWLSTSPQFGQTMLVDENKYGTFTDEEAPKKSITDCIAKCAVQLGIGADIHLGLYDDNKYVNERRAEETAAAQAKAKLTPPPAPATELTEAETRALDRKSERDMRGETDEPPFDEGEADEPHALPTGGKTATEWGTELVGYYKASTDLGTLMAWRTANEKIIDQLGPKAIESLAKAYKARYDAIIATMEPAEPVLP